MRQRPCETVLFVNDDPSFIDLVGDALRAQGVAVLLVPGVEQGARALQTGFRPDAVLLDVGAGPDLHGLVDLLGRDLDLRRVPILARSRVREELVHLAPDGAARPLDIPADAGAFARLLDRMCGAAGAALYENGGATR